MAKQKKRTGPKKGTQTKPGTLALTRGHRLSIYLMAADYARLRQVADARRLTIAHLVRGLVLSGLDSGNGTTHAA